MALEKKITLKNGLEVDNAYIRIDTISGYKGNLDISVNSYLSKKDFEDGKELLSQKFYKFSPETNSNSKEIWTQGYEFLKTLKEYEGSIDILE